MKRLFGYGLLAVIGFYLWKNHFAGLFQPKDQIQEKLDEVDALNNIGNNKRSSFLANQPPRCPGGRSPTSLCRGSRASRSGR